MVGREWPGARRGGRRRRGSSCRSAVCASLNVGRRCDGARRGDPADRRLTQRGRGRLLATWSQDLLETRNRSRARWFATCRTGFRRLEALERIAPAVLPEAGGPGNWNCSRVGGAGTTPARRAAAAVMAILKGRVFEKAGVHLDRAEPSRRNPARRSRRRPDDRASGRRGHFADVHPSARPGRPHEHALCRTTEGLVRRRQDLTPVDRRAHAGRRRYEGLSDTRDAAMPAFDKYKQWCDDFPEAPQRTARHPAASSMIISTDRNSDWKEGFRLHARPERAVWSRCARTRESRGEADDESAARGASVGINLLYDRGTIFRPAMSPRSGLVAAAGRRVQSRKRHMTEK